MQTIAKSVFRYERIGDSGYTPSSSFGKSRYAPYLPLDADIEEFDEKNVEQILSCRFTDLHLLGPYEKYVLHRLFSRQNTMNAIVGAKGCGKTATAQFLRGFVDKYERSSDEDFKRPLVAYVDGNDIVPPQLHTDSEKVAYINTHLADKLRTSLLKYWTELAKILADHARRPRERTDSHVEKLLGRVQQRIGSRSLTRNVLRDTVIDVLETQSPENRVFFLLSIFGTLFSRNKNRFVYLCIDNLDPLDVVVQLNLAHWLTSVINPSQLPVLLVMRIITFRRCKSAALHLGVIPHYGVTPLREIENRFRDLISRRTINLDFEKSTLKIKAGFLLRSSEILGYFNGHDEHPDEFKNVMRAVCGMSVQRGLAAVQRLYSNDQYVRALQNRLTDEDIEHVLSRISQLRPVSSDGQIFAAVDAIYEDFRLINDRLSGTDNDWPKKLPKTYHYSNLLFQNSDLANDEYGPIIANLFRCGMEESFSTIRLRILMLVKRTSSNRKRAIKVRAIANLLSKLGFNIDQVCDAINELHFQNRRLIWCTGHNEFDSVEQLRADWNEDVGITGSGRYYLEHLTRNLDYLAMMFADDDGERANVFGGDATTRLTFAARLLYEALLHELDWAQRVLDGRTPASPDDAKQQADFIVLPKFILPTLVGVERMLSKHHRNLKEDGRTRASAYLREQVEELKTKQSNFDIRCSQLEWTLGRITLPEWQRAIDARKRPCR